MQECFRDVLAFHRAVDQMPPTGPPTVPDKQTENRRFRLNREEYHELLEAMLDGDLSKIADGIADLIYVAIGTAIAYGIDLVPVWNAVQAANMTKISGPIDVDGKRLKPDGFKHPDIEAILAAQRPLAEIYRTEDGDREMTDSERLNWIDGHKIMIFEVREFVGEGYAIRDAIDMAVKGEDWNDE